jgi:tRNA threonylcarbamoyl adenosine modification protein YjeE
MTTNLVFSEVDEPELCRVAELVALFVRPGEMIALSGELGAGKTAFARAFVRAILDDADVEVPSPTFNLLQLYESPRFPIAHLDLYRLSNPSEVGEVVADDALAGSVAVVEWPERIASLLPPSRLDVRISEAGTAGLRTLELVGHAAWSSRLNRLGEVRRFLLDELGQDIWSRARLRYLQGDASARAYARLFVDDTTHILMDAPRMPDGPPIRNGLPYSRIAHLAEDVRPFVAIGRALEEIGIAAPHIRAQDIHRGLLLLEDLGDLTLGRAIDSGFSQRNLWSAAVDVLVSVRRAGLPRDLPLSTDESHNLPEYDRDALGIETELLVDWYWPMLKGGPPSAEARDEFVNLWGAQFDRLPISPMGWVLRDYHSPNLMWRPEQEGLARIGVLDFQDALQGPWAYDLMSLLQDARVDVPPALEAELFARYCDRVAAIEPGFDRTSFADAYAALGAQRNTKILGIFARLARRDGKTIYLRHIPRIWTYLGRNLAQPSLEPLRVWYDRHFPQPVRTAVPSA